jgi:hypothetical protein
MISFELIFSSGNFQDKATTDSTNNNFCTKSRDKELKEKGSEKEYVKTDTHTISYFDF